MEAGSHANWVYRLLERLGHEPPMADTHRLALITQSLSKDDRTDAERLAELGLRRPAMLNPIKPCSRETQSDRTGLKAREASSIVLIGISLYCGHLAQSNIVWMPR